MMDIEDDEPISRGRVYFIVARKAGTVKVGFSANLRKRMIDLQTSASEPLAMAFSCAGDRELERALHAFLAPHVVSGEWFRYGAHIHDLIDEMCDFLSEKAGDADEFGVPITAAELRRVVTSPTYGKTDAEIHAAACGNRGEC